MPWTVLWEKSMVDCIQENRTETEDKRRRLAMKKKIIKTIFTIIYCPLGLFILGCISAIFMVVIGESEPLPNLPGGIIGIIVASLIGVPLVNLEKKLLGKDD